jgi:hypothetical protein
MEPPFRGEGGQLGQKRGAGGQVRFRSEVNAGQVRFRSEVSAGQVRFRSEVNAGQVRFSSGGHKKISNLVI